MSRKSFKDAYGVLQRHSGGAAQPARAQHRRPAGHRDESVEAYKACTSRIDAVEQALDQALGGTGIATPAAGPGRSVIPRPEGQAAGVTALVSGSDANEDDVPF